MESKMKRTTSKEIFEAAKEYVKTHGMDGLTTATLFNYKGREYKIGYFRSNCMRRYKSLEGVEKQEYLAKFNEIDPCFLISKYDLRAQKMIAATLDYIETYSYDTIKSDTTHEYNEEIFDIGLYRSKMRVKYSSLTSDKKRVSMRSEFDKIDVKYLVCEYETVRKENIDAVLDFVDKYGYGSLRSGTVHLYNNKKYKLGQFRTEQRVRYKNAPEAKKTDIESEFDALDESFLKPEKEDIFHHHEHSKLMHVRATLDFLKTHYFEQLNSRTKHFYLDKEYNIGIFMTNQRVKYQDTESYLDRKILREEFYVINPCYLADTSHLESYGLFPNESDFILHEVLMDFKANHEVSEFFDHPNYIYKNRVFNLDNLRRRLLSRVQKKKISKKDTDGFFDDFHEDFLDPVVFCASSAREVVRNKHSVHYRGKISKSEKEHIEATLDFIDLYGLHMIDKKTVHVYNGKSIKIGAFREKIRKFFRASPSLRRGELKRKYQALGDGYLTEGFLVRCSERESFKALVDFCQKYGYDNMNARSVYYCNEEKYHLGRFRALMRMRFLEACENNKNEVIKNMKNTYASIDEAFLHDEREHQKEMAFQATLDFIDKYGYEQFKSVTTHIFKGEKYNIGYYRRDKRSQYAMADNRKKREMKQYYARLGVKYLQREKARRKIITRNGYNVKIDRKNIAATLDFLKENEVCDIKGESGRKFATKHKFKGEWYNLSSIRNKKEERFAELKSNEERLEFIERYKKLPLEWLGKRAVEFMEKIDSSKAS